MKKNKIISVDTMKKMIGIIDFSVVKEKAYISNRFCNSLIIYNIQKMAIEQVERFIHMDDFSFAYHRGCLEHNRIIYFYPDSGYGVHSYNTNNGCQKYYELGFSRVGYSYVFEEKLILFPWYSEQGIIIIDLKKDMIEVNPSWWNVDKILGEKKVHFLNHGLYNDNKIWSHCTNTNLLFISDCHQCIVEKNVINVEKKALWGSQYDGKDFWFTVIDEQIIYQWNIKSGIVNKFELNSTIWEKTYEVSPYRKIICAQDYVFLIPYNENALFLLNKKTEKIELISKFPKEVIYPKTKYWNIEERIDGDQLYLFCDLTNLIIQVDLNSLDVFYKEAQIVESQIFDEYTKQIWKSSFQSIDNTACLYENEFDWKTYLPNFIRLNCERHSYDTKSFYEVSIGNEIYRKVMTE